MTRSSSFGRDVGVYGLGTLLAQSATVLATPIFTRLLGPAAYGIVDLLVVALAFFGVVLMLGLDVAVTRFIPMAEVGDRRSIVSMGLVVSFGLSFVAGLVLAALSAPIASGYLQQSSDQFAVVLTAGLLPLSVATIYTREVLRAHRRPWAFLASACVASFVQVSCGIVAIVHFDAGITGVFVGLAIGTVCSLLFNAVAVGRELVPGWSAQRARELVRFGLPIMWSQLAGWSVMFADRIVLSTSVDNAEIGYYALANRIAMVVNLVVYTFGRAWTPFALRVVEADRARSVEQRAVAMGQVLGVVSIVGVAIAAPAPEIVELVGGPGFGPAADMVPVLVGAFLCFATVPLTMVVALANNRPQVLAKPAIAAAVLNLVACFALIPHLGAIGAAWASVVGFGFQAVAYLVITERIEHTPYPRRQLLLLALLTVPALGAGFIELDGAVVGIIVKAGIVASYVAILLLTGVVSPAKLRWLARSGVSADVDVDGPVE